jgi:hypothetical protein
MQQADSDSEVGGLQRAEALDIFRRARVILKGGHETCTGLIGPRALRHELGPSVQACGCPILYYDLLGLSSSLRDQPCFTRLGIDQVIWASES